MRVQFEGEPAREIDVTSEGRLIWHGAPVGIITSDSLATTVALLFGGAEHTILHSDQTGVIETRLDKQQRVMATVLNRQVYVNLTGTVIRYLGDDGRLICLLPTLRYLKDVLPPFEEGRQYIVLEGSPLQDETRDDVLTPYRGRDAAFRPVWAGSSGGTFLWRGFTRLGRPVKLGG